MSEQLGQSKVTNESVLAVFFRLFFDNGKQITFSELILSYIKILAELD